MLLLQSWQAGCCGAVRRLPLNDCILLSLVSLQVRFRTTGAAAVAAPFSRSYCCAVNNLLLAADQPSDTECLLWPCCDTPVAATPCSPPRSPVEDSRRALATTTTTTTPTPTPLKNNSNESTDERREQQRQRRQGRKIKLPPFLLFLPHVLLLLSHKPTNNDCDNVD